MAFRMVCHSLLTQPHFSSKIDWFWAFKHLNSQPWLDPQYPWDASDQKLFSHSDPSFLSKQEKESFLKQSYQLLQRILSSWGPLFDTLLVAGMEIERNILSLADWNHILGIIESNVVEITPCHPVEAYLMGLRKLPNEQKQAARDILSTQCPELLQANFEGEESGGFGLFSTISMLNHSCVPNCWVETAKEDPFYSKVISLQDIKAGEELTINYLETGLPFHQRKNHLRLIYRFDCDCSLCQEGAKEEMIGCSFWVLSKRLQERSIIKNSRRRVRNRRKRKRKRYQTKLQLSLRFRLPLLLT